MSDKPSATPSIPLPAGEPSSRSGRPLRWRAVAWSTTAALVVGTVVLIGVVAARKPPPVPPPQKKLTGVATMVVQPREHRERLELPARLEADHSAVLSSELAGRLDAWLVDEGAAVEAGQEVARLNTDDLETQLRLLQARQATAERTVAVSEGTLAMARVSLTQAERNAAALRLDLETARAAFDLAGKEYERAKTLSAAAVATQADFDRADNARTLARLGVAKAEDALDRSGIAVEAAKVAVTQADAALALSRSQVQETERQIEGLKVTLGKMHIRAPFAGRFEEHLIEVGEVVSPGEALGRLYDLAWLRAAVDVPDRYAPLLDASSALVQRYIDVAMPGARQDIQAAVTIPGLPRLTGGTYAGVELPAVVHRVAQAASPTSNTFRVELRLQNPGDALKEGIIARATISFLRYDQAIVIPFKAVQVAEVGPRVLVVETVGGRSIARVRDVEPVSIQNDELLVRSGLNAGDRLVVSGAKGIVDGEEVQVVIADGKVQPTAGADGAPATAPGGAAP